MKYCRFLLANRIHYGRVEERKGEFWITGPAPLKDSVGIGVTALTGGALW